MSLGMELCLGPGDFVLDGDPAPPPIFGYVYCGQPDGWMKLVLGMEVGPSTGDFVLDGDPGPLPQKGAERPPQCLLWQTAGWIKMSLVTKVGLSPGDCVRW